MHHFCSPISLNGNDAECLFGGGSAAVAARARERATPTANLEGAATCVLLFSRTAKVHLKHGEGQSALLLKTGNGREGVGIAHVARKGEGRVYHREADEPTKRAHSHDLHM